MEQLKVEPPLFEVFLHFDPVTPRTGSDTTIRKAKLRSAIVEQVTTEKLLHVRETLRGRLVKLSVVFNLWKTPPTEADTRWIKDIDNLLKMLFDVLGSGAQGLKLVDDDSYICQVQATKKLVPSKEQVGYLIKIEEYNDEQMRQSLNVSFAKRPKS
jgi:Holliday junction resolvase RusA-like endonuclease